MGDLPPGFRFYPTDEELVVHFLHRKAALLPCHPDVIPDLELYPYDPWDLDGKALSEGRMWYYYSRRTSSIRMTESGCWKPMGIDDEPVYSNTTGKRVGMKKYYTFHLGYDDDDSSSDHEYSSSTMGWTNWVMHEYRLPDRRSTSSSSSSSSTRRSRSSRSSSDHSRWVICKVFEENNDSGGGGAQLSCLDEVFLSMDDSCYDEIISSFPTN